MSEEDTIILREAQLYPGPYLMAYWYATRSPEELGYQQVRRENRWEGYG